MCIRGVIRKTPGIHCQLEGDRGEPEQGKSHRGDATPRTEKEVRGLLGRLQYISRFLSQLTPIYEPIFKLLKKNAQID